MNLKNLNLVELNAQEVQEVDGGLGKWFWPSAAATFLYNCFADYEQNMKAYDKGRLAAKE